MKKNSLTIIANVLSTLPTDTLFDNPLYDGKETTRKQIPLTEILSEVQTELNKGKEKKDATATAYAEMWEKVRQALTDATAPVTAQEIADETGLTRGKIVYGLTNYWANEVIKDTSGKSTTYALKA